MEFWFSKEALQLHLVIVSGAFVIDLILGDPVYPFHPIRLLGNFVNVLEKSLFKFNIKGYLGGIILWFCTLLSPMLLYFSLMKLFQLTDSSIGYFIALDLFIYYSLFSANDLIKHVANVSNSLKKKEIEDSRKALSMIVGRSTEKLDRSQISKAAVETLAENSSDGIIAPLFYALIFGIPGILIYKAANTLDSMVGYKNEKYSKFGFLSAKMDDFFNFIPARLTALIILFYNLFNPKIFIRFWKSRRAHLSPNAGFPEAAMAAILNVKMGGAAEYGNEIVHKEYINPDGRDTEPEDIEKAITIIRTRILIIILVLVFSLFFIRI